MSIVLFFPMKQKKHCEFRGKSNFPSAIFYKHKFSIEEQQKKSCLDFCAQVFWTSNKSVSSPLHSVSKFSAALVAWPMLGAVVNIARKTCVNVMRNYIIFQRCTHTHWTDITLTNCSSICHIRQQSDVLMSPILFLKWQYGFGFHWCKSILIMKINRRFTARFNK